MKKGLFLSAAIICVSFAIWHWNKENKEHRNKFGIEELEEDQESPSQRAEMNAERFRYEFDMLKDPKTGKIPNNIYQLELEQAMRMPLAGNQGRLNTANGIVLSGLGANGPTTNTYQLAGPNNIAGRTRAFAFDLRYNGTTNKVIISGSVSGGLMRSTDGGANWTLVAPDKQIHNLSCLAQDPKTPDTWYAGTGESLGNSASGGSGSGAFYLGNGVYKSTDNGASWTALASTQLGSIEVFDNVFDLVNKIAINPVNGDVYVACLGTIKKSKDGGTSWTTVKQSTSLGNNVTGNTDVCVTKDGTKIYCAFHNKSTDKGVYQSTSGDASTWSLIAGGSDNLPLGWRTNVSTDINNNWGRVLLALAPSNNNILYVMYENGQSQASPSLLPEADLFKADFTSGAPVWTNLSSSVPDMPGGSKDGSDPIAVQGGYNMLLVVKPDDPNTVFMGGTNLYRSTNGFSNATTTSWIGGYSTDFTTSIYPNSHPDMHFLAFDPSNPKRAVICNDGGLQVTNDITTSTVAWTQINNYQTIQYYSVAIDPEIGKNNFEGGAQDNGTWYRDASLNFGTRPSDRPGINDYVNLLGGDGVAVDIAKISGGQQLTYFGVQSGIIVRDELLNNASYPGAVIKPKVADMIPNSGSGYGDFITNFKLSNANSEILFYANYNRLFKTNAASTVDSSKWTRLLGVENTLNSVPGDNSVSIRAMDFSWGSYQTTHSMYFGTNTGKLYRIDDYANANALTIPKDISPNGLQGNVSDIAVNPNDDNEILVVVSNYGVTSAFWTYNAKSATPSWSNAEGDLSLPSYRSCAIVPRKDANGNPYTEYYIGTSVGLYSTQNIGKTLGATPAGSIIWSREGASVLNYAVVASLDYRPEDNTLLIGTHGNGMFYTVIGTPNFTPNLPTALPNTIIDDKNFVKIYPTVSTGNYRYQAGNIAGIKSIQLEVINMSGQTVYQTKTGYTDGSIPLNRLPAGSYVVHIISDNKKYVSNQKIIKH